MLNFNPKKYFFLMVACICHSCQQYHRLEMGACLAKPAKQSTSSLEMQPEDAATRPSLPKSVLVLLHGLTMDASESDPVKEVVKQRFGKGVEVIQPKCREGLRSARLSIDKQAQKVVKEIKATLRKRYPQYADKELKALPINIFGFSQGGLVACILARNHKDELNIKSVIAVNAPLSGTYILENNASNLNKFNEKAKPGLDAIGHPKTSLYGAKSLGIALNSFGLKRLTNWLFKGVRDIRIGSTCTANIKEFIRADKHNIPILLIAGYISNLSEYFDFAEEDKEQAYALIKSLAELITGQEDGEHDLLINTKSELARGPSFENLTVSKDDPVYPKNVEIYIAKDELHCYNLVAILSDFTVNQGETPLQSKKTQAVITDFIAKHNHLNIEK